MLKFYWDIGLRERWPILAMIVALALVTPFFQIANIGMIVPIMTVLLGQPDDLRALNLPIVHRFADAWAGLPKTHVLIWLIVLMGGLLVVKNLLTVARSYAAMRLLTHMRFTVTQCLFERYLRAGYGRQLSQPSGATQHQIWDSPIYVAETVRAGSELLANALQFLFLAAFMLLISWKLLLLTMPLAVVAALAFDRLFRRRLQTISVENDGVMTRTKALMKDAMDGVRQIKAYAAESPVLSSFQAHMQGLDRLDDRYARLRYWPSALNELFLVILATVLILVGTLVPQFRLEVSYLVAFMLAIVRLGPTATGLAEAYVSLHAASKNVEVARSFLKNWEPERDRGRRSPPSRIAELQFRGVSFAYPNRPTVPVLRDASLGFRINDITALVGKTGAGKSTIADLMIRLYDPLAGTIEADGVDIREFGLAAWRRRVGFVSQDTFLFNASIRENIVLSDPSASMDDVRAVARQAHIHELIESLPEGYETVVGDRGVLLSGGQRQRIAVARALLTGAQILVLDEATSALDAVAERAILETINELREGRIVIVIAHRLSTIVHANKIAVLEGGCVREEGSHDELMERGAAYARLYSLSEP